MIQIKVHGETPRGGKSICHTCKNAKIVKGQNCEEYIACGAYEMFKATGGRVPFKVAECSKYHPVNMPWLHEMEEMAWIVEARKRGPAGFGEAVAEGQMEVIVRRPHDREDTPGSPTD